MIRSTYLPVQLRAQAEIERRKRGNELSAFAIFQRTYRHQAAAFVHDCLRFRGDGPTPYQTEILERLPGEKRIAVRGPHGIGKCMEWDEEIQLADGRWVCCGDLVGRVAELPAVGKRLEPTIAGAMFTDNGLREVVEIETKRGRILRRTLNHPLLADPEPYRWDETVSAKRLRPVAQWIDAGQLRPGDVLVIADSSVPYRSKPQPEAHIKLAAYLLGDGGLTSGGVRFTNTSDEIMDEFADVCQALSCEIKTNSGDENTVDVVAAEGGPRLKYGQPYNQVRDLVRRWAMDGVGSHDKRFPDWVWSLPRSQLAICLSRLYACDGWAADREIGYATTSWQLARDVSRALLRLGINANWLCKATAWEHNGTKKQGICYQVVINDSDGILAFSERIGIFAKDEAIDRVVDWALNADPHYTQKWQGFGLPYGYHWEKIVRVEPLGIRPTVAVTVPGPQTFVTEFVEHNTALASWVVLWAILTVDDCKAPTTASAWRQLTKFLWPEIHKWAARVRWDRVGRGPFDGRREMLALSLKRGATCEAFAVASDNADLIEGAHAERIVYVYDEAKAVPDATFDATEGAFSGAGSDTGAEAFALAISTPGEPQGRFYDIHARKAGYEDWTTRHVTVEEAIAAGRISREWAEQRKRQWGENSAVYQNRVLGEFAASEEDGVIPLAWVERANERWREWVDAGRPLPPAMTTVGVDVARAGGDLTVLALRYGWIISEIRTYDYADTMRSVGAVVGVLSKGGKAIIDVVGVGAGVFDCLREKKQPAVAFTAGAKSYHRDRSGELGFADLRSAAWWNMRELLETEPVALPPDDDLTGELTAPKWREQSGGKIKVESKDEIRRRLKRSTDKADGVIQAFADNLTGARTTLGVASVSLRR